MITLVSIVGAKKSGYATCCYQFDDGGQFQTCLFGYAVLQRLRQAGASVHRWVLLGTQTSDWPVLHAICGESGIQSADDRVWEELTDEIVGGGAQQTTLDRIGHATSKVMGCELRPRIIANDADSVFSALYDELGPDETVVLDITHGFRTIPMYCVLALGALRWMKGVTLADLTYGQFDGERAAGKPAPAVSLQPGVRLAEMAPLAAKVAITDDLGAAADICELFEIGDRAERRLLRRQAVQDSLLFGDLAHADRQKVANKLAGWQTQPNSISGVAADWVRDLVGEPGGFPVDHHFRRAEQFCRRGDYLRALLLLVDAYRLEIVRWAGLDASTTASAAVRELARGEFDSEVIDDIHVLNGLRNSSAHGDRKSHGRVRQLRQDPEKSVAFINSMVSGFRAFKNKLAEVEPPESGEDKDNMVEEG